MPRSRAQITIAILFASMSVSRSALAYRPFDGTDADVAETGVFELELGPAHLFSQAGSLSLISPATVLNLGFAPGFELVADFQNFVAIDKPPGQARDSLLDTDLFVKAVLLRGSLQEAGAGPSMALELGPLLPNVNGESGFGASCNLIVSERWHDFAMHMNNWLELTRGDLHADWFEGVILEGPFDAPVRPVSELFVEHEFVTGTTTWSALVGGIWRARDGLDLDLGLREALVGHDTVAEVRVGFTWSIGIWEPRSDTENRASLHGSYAFHR